jgi:hypothetical protein
VSTDKLSVFGYRRRRSRGANLTSDVVHAEGLAALMTVLRDFIDEIASELDACADKPLAPHHWISFVKLLAAIDRDDEMGELRQQMEQIVSQRDVRFQDRCLALIPLLRAHLPGGGKLQ